MRNKLVPYRLTLAALTLVWAAGCAANNNLNARRADDPLLGGKSQLGNTQQRQAAAPVNPSTRGPSTASLATAPRPGFGQDTRLAIDNRPNNGTRPQPVQPTSFNNNGMTLEQALNQLRTRGVTWHNLENRNGAWHFSCSRPNPRNPAVDRLYEANDADQVRAIVAVMAQMDRDR